MKYRIHLKLDNGKEYNITEKDLDEDGRRVLESTLRIIATHEEFEKKFEAIENLKNSNRSR